MINPIVIIVVIIEYVVFSLVAWRVGVILDRGLINKDKVNNYPNEKKYDKQQSDNPFPPTRFKDYEGTNSKRTQPTKKQAYDAFPRFIAHSACALRSIIRRQSTKCKQNQVDMYYLGVRNAVPAIDMVVVLV